VSLHSHAPARLINPAAYTVRIYQSEPSNGEILATRREFQMYGITQKTFRQHIAGERRPPLKKETLYYLLIVIPFIFTVFAWKYKGDDFEVVFDDKRAVSNAERLEDIKGKVARGSSRVPPSSSSFPRAGETTYTVKPGDTWWGIANKHGVNDYLKLKKHNGNRELVAGMTVKIPRAMIDQ